MNKFKILVIDIKYLMKLGRLFYFNLNELKVFIRVGGWLWISLLITNN
jgi:hypothetical protein